MSLLPYHRKPHHLALQAEVKHLTSSSPRVDSLRQHPQKLKKWVIKPHMLGQSPVSTQANLLISSSSAVGTGRGQCHLAEVRGSEKQMVRKSIRPQPSRTMGPLSSALAPLVLSHLHRPRIKGLELAEPPSFFQFSLLWLPNHPPAHHPSSCLLPRPSLSYESLLLPSYLWRKGEQETGELEVMCASSLGFISESGDLLSNSDSATQWLCTGALQYLLCILIAVFKKGAEVRKQTVFPL